MKNIWIVNQYAYCDSDSASTRHLSYASALIDKGYPTTVITSSFFHKRRVQRNRVKGSSHLMTKERNVPFVWLKVPSYRSNLTRLFNMVVFPVLVIFGGYRKQLAAPQVIVVTSPNPFAVIAAACLAKVYRARLILEVVDIWPQTLIEVAGVSRYNPLIVVLRGVERLNYKIADAIFTHLSSAPAYFASKGADIGKTRYIPSPVVIDTQLPGERVTEASDGKIVFQYLGSLSPSYAPEQLVEAVNILRQESPEIFDRLQFEYVGSGPLKSTISRAIEQKSLSGHIKLLDAVPKAEIGKVLERADVGLVLAADLELHKYGVSFNKIFDYMTFAKPMIFACNDKANIAIESGCAISCAPDNPRSLAQTIEQFARMDDSMRREIGEKGRNQVLANNSIDQWVDRFIPLLEN